MTTPGQKHLWKNIDWKTKEEKGAFFNKYFSKSEFVQERINAAIEEQKSDLLRFIENNKVQEGKETRPIKITDIKQKFT